MGIMDKFKNLFTEEVEEEKPIQKEVRHVEIPSPKKELEPKKKEENHISDSSAIKNEEKFVFPVYFDDKDFDDLEKPKEIKKEKKNDTKPKIEAYQGSFRKEIKIEEEKRFTPSLIISPVYGVLDKNYHKDDILAKHTLSSDHYYKQSDHMTIDDIRDKAYGTLEDELKNNILGSEKIRNEKQENTETAIDLFNELNFDELDQQAENKTEKNEHHNNSLLFEDSSFDEDTAFLAQQLEEQKRKLDEINDYIQENTVEKKKDVKEPEELETKEESNEKTEENQIEKVEENNQEKEDKQDSDLTESELFHLIDSMYEQKEEE